MQLLERRLAFDRVSDVLAKPQMNDIQVWDYLDIILPER